MSRRRFRKPTPCPYATAYSEADAAFEAVRYDLPVRDQRRVELFDAAYLAYDQYLQTRDASYNRSTLEEYLSRDGDIWYTPWGSAIDMNNEWSVRDCLLQIWNDERE